ncbi:protein kinase domain-containing protein [Nocardia brasiliensis]|uniref:bifunctional serine/threonine-protein kinase/ABC transporter substrate-binding protein n=1 Tax=Nocardia brasiliensis TaxID=37326 RepID=UPI003A5CD05F
MGEDGMLRAGEIFAGYVVERRLGRGGMGSVYLARHPRLPRRIALKLLSSNLHADKEMLARFEREAELVARLDHPNIVAVYDRGIDDDTRWISMQYVDGTDAGALDPRSLAPRRAIQIVAETAKALDYAHAVGVLHRDVKPANILLARATAGQDERILLTDFGIARLRDESQQLTRTGMFAATLAYASPEQLSAAPVDHRSDQYALACTLFWLLTGTAPFVADSPAGLIAGHLQQSPPAVGDRRPGLPPALNAVLARALAKTPDERFASCTEFATAALHAISDPAVNELSAPPTTPQAWVRPAESPQRQAGSPATRSAGDVQAETRTAKPADASTSAIPGPREESGPTLPETRIASALGSHPETRPAEWPATLSENASPASRARDTRPGPAAEATAADATAADATAADGVPVDGVAAGAMAAGVVAADAAAVPEPQDIPAGSARSGPPRQTSDTSSSNEFGPARPVASRARRRTGIGGSVLVVATAAVVGAVWAFGGFNGGHKTPGGATAAIEWAGAIAPGTSGAPRTVAPLAQIDVQGRQLPKPATVADPAGDGKATCAPVTIAVTGPTGPGRYTYGAVELAVDRFTRANPGCTVTVREVDTAGGAAALTAGRIVQDQSTVALIGPMISDEIRTVGAVFDNAGLPFLTPSATDPTLSTNGWSSFFRALAADDVQGAALAKYLVGTAHFRKICVVEDKSGYGRSLAGSVVAGIGAAADAQCGAEISRGERGFATVVADIAAARPDAVFYSGRYEEAAELLRQLRGAGVTAPFVSAESTVTTDFVAAAGDSAAGALISCSCAPVVSRFAADYEALNGQLPGPGSAEAYDLTTIVLKGIAAGQDTRPKLLTYLHNYDGTGLARTYRWTATGEPAVPDIWLYKVD